MLIHCGSRSRFETEDGRFLSNPSSGSESDRSRPGSSQTRPPSVSVKSPVASNLSEAIHLSKDKPEFDNVSERGNLLALSPSSGTKELVSGDRVLCRTKCKTDYFPGVLVSVYLNDQFKVR